MKEHRVKPSKAAVTTIDVSGRQHHYTHSKRLGKIRAILIPEDENLPIPYRFTDEAKKILAEKSHRQEIEEILDETERKEALYSELDDLLAYLPTIPLDNFDEYESTLGKIKQIHDEISEIESD